jgi:hypothetical protein
MHAQDDSITQSQQLLEIIQSSSVAQPDAFSVEPVTRTGLPASLKLPLQKALYGLSVTAMWTAGDERALADIGPLVC